MSEDVILLKLYKAVVEGQVEEAELAAKEALKAMYDPLKVIEEGLSKGIREVGDRFSRGELYLPELMISAEAMKAGMRILLNKIKRQKKEIKYSGRIVLGTVAGDIHDIGKSLMGTFLAANGYEVIDLGADVPAETFIDKVRELKPDILGLSALMTTTMLEQRRVIEALERAGLRDKVKVIIGGASTGEEWAEEIGADAHGADAVDAVEKVKRLLSR